MRLLCRLGWHVRCDCHVFAEAYAAPLIIRRDYANESTLALEAPPGPVVMVVTVVPPDHEPMCAICGVTVNGGLFHAEGEGMVCRRCAPRHVLVGA